MQRGMLSKARKKVKSKAKKAAKNIAGRFWTKEIKGECKRLGIPFKRLTTKKKAKGIIRERIEKLKNEIRDPRKIQQEINADMRELQKDFTILTHIPDKLKIKALNEVKGMFEKGITPTRKMGIHLSGKHFNTKWIEDRMVKLEVELIRINGMRLHNKARREKLTGLRKLLLKFK